MVLNIGFCKTDEAMEDADEGNIPSKDNSPPMGELEMEASPLLLVEKLELELESGGDRNSDVDEPPDRLLYRVLGYNLDSKYVARKSTAVGFWNISMSSVRAQRTSPSPPPLLLTFIALLLPSAGFVVTVVAVLFSILRLVSCVKRSAKEIVSY